MTELPNPALVDLVGNAGGVKQLANDLGVSRQYAYACVHKGYLPPKHAIYAAALYDVDRAKLVDPMLLPFLEMMKWEPDALAYRPVARRKRA